jgi:hypothetical protein
MKFKVLKKLSVFDFDDTLVQTDAKIKVVNKGLELSSLEFGKYQRENDDVFDYTDFRTGKLKNPKPTAFFYTGFKNIVSGQSDIMILTARPQTEEISKFLLPYVMGKTLIIVGGADTPEMKKNEITKFLGKYDVIRFYDDSVSNIAAVNTLKNEAKKLGTNLVTRVIKPK